MPSRRRRRRARTSGYVLGRSRENNLRYKLMREGWFAIRCIGSKGGMPAAVVKPIDLVAIKRGEPPRFIQVSKRRSAITSLEQAELVRLGRAYGAQPFLAYKRGRSWVFEELDGAA